MLRNGLVMSAIGLAIVFLVLLLLVAVLTAVRRLDVRWRSSEREAEDGAVDLPPSIDSLTVVLIAAAVGTYLQGRARIRRIRRLPLRADLTSTPWSQQGRLVLQGSHVVGPPRSR